MHPSAEQREAGHMTPISRVATAALRDFARGMHAAHAIRHGVKQPAGQDTTKTKPKTR
jgi:hypothetical protein